MRVFKVGQRPKIVGQEAIITDIFSSIAQFEAYDTYREHSPDDSRLWLQLMVLAEKHSGKDLASILRYIRNTGAVLVADKRFGYVIKPVIGAHGFASREDWERERHYLLPHAGKISAWLKELAHLKWR